MEPTSRPLSPVVRYAMVVPLTLGAAYAALLLTLASAHTDALFAWTMSPVSATLVGAGYAGSCAMLWLCATRAKAWTHARVTVLAASLFMLLMLAAMLLDHRTLHLRGGEIFAVLAAFGWFGVHLVAPLIGAVGLGVQFLGAGRGLGANGGGPGRPESLPWWIALPTFSSGLFLTAVGALLFAAPAWPARHWPWTVGRLDVRVIAAFGLTFGLAMLATVGERELRRVRHGMVAMVVTGTLGLVGLVRYADQVRWSSLGAWGVVAVLMLFLGMGLAGLGLSAILPESLPPASPAAAGVPSTGAGNPA